MQGTDSENCGMTVLKIKIRDKNNLSSVRFQPPIRRLACIQVSQKGEKIKVQAIGEGYKMKRNAVKLNMKKDILATPRNGFFRKTKKII